MKSPGKHRARGRKPWPVLKSYDARHVARIAMPLGGIGCGSVSLGGNGAWRDWELFNRPAKGFIPCSSEIGPCVLLHMERDGEPAVMRLAEGPLDFGDYEGFIGSIRPNHGLPRFRDCAFHYAYPLGQVHLRDKSSPLDVRVEKQAMGRFDEMRFGTTLEAVTTATP